MASITLAGTLLDPTGEVAVGDQIRFTHRTTTGETIQFARSVLIIPPNGLYNITLEFGLIFVEYLDIKDVHYKKLGIVTVNQDSTATDLPGLLNAIVPPTDAQLLLFQGILADTEDARDIALLAAAQQTTLELIASTTTHPNSTVLTLSGHTLPGDGGGGKWQLNGVVGQTTSQSPTQLADFLLNDGNGNQWALVDGVILAFNGVQYLPLPFGATGNGNYAYNDNDFDKIVDPDRLNPATLAIALGDTSLEDGGVLELKEHTTSGGGGATWDVFPASTFTVGATIFNVFNHDTLPLQLKIRPGQETMKTLGATANTDASAILTNLLTLVNDAKIGEYSSPPLITGVAMAVGKIISDGKLKTTTDATMITLATDATIKNVELLGDGKDTGKTSQHLVFDPTSAVGITLENVKLRDAGGRGFLPAVTVTSKFFGGTLTNVEALDCNIGLDFAERGEYFNVIGGHAHGCNQGVIDQAGNINFNGMIITDNTEGYRLAAGTNDAHGITYGLQINHNTTNIFIEKINSKNHLFQACNVFEGIIHFFECEGITFQGGAWGAVVVNEEGATNCFVKDVYITDQRTINPNHNGKPSEVLYSDIVQSSTATAIDTSRINGLYSFSRFTVLDIAWPTGSQVLIMDQTTAELPFNPTYTVQKIYDIVTGEIPVKNMSIRGSRFIRVDATITIGRGGSLDPDPDLVRVYLKNKTTGARNFQFAPGELEAAGSTRLRTWELNAVVPKENYEIEVLNNTGGVLQMQPDTPTNAVNIQLNRMTITEVI